MFPPCDVDVCGKCGGCQEAFDGLIRAFKNFQLVSHGLSRRHDLMSRSRCDSEWVPLVVMPALTERGEYQTFQLSRIFFCCSDEHCNDEFEPTTAQLPTFG